MDWRAPLKLALALVGCSASAQIREFDFAAHLRRRFADSCPEPRVSIHTIEYLDLTGDGADEAVVVASSCLTGTAGPDIHAVFRFDPAAHSVLEIPIAEAREFRGKPLFSHLVGNRNKRLIAANGELVEDYYDGSGREHPLRIHYRYAGPPAAPGGGESFRIVSVEWPSVYRASFDCARARAPNEIVVCAHADLAAGDRLTAKAYRRALARLALPAERAALRAAQAAWLKDRDQICVPYKGQQGADCLRELYAQRRAALEAAGERRSGGVH